MPKIIEERHFATAEELLTALSPFDGFWSQTGGLDCWLFRGQRDDSWPLQPTAGRSTFMSYGIGVAEPRSIASLADQLNAENEVVMHFVGESLNANLPVPEDGQWLRADGIVSRAFGTTLNTELQQGVDFPFPLYRSLFALAQHHGVPTRFLDWSRDPLIGAYFASAEVARSLATTKGPPDGTKGTNVAVFALRRIVFDYVSATPAVGVPPKGYDRSLIEVSAPYAENPNLRAQQGTFTLVKFTTERDQTDWRIPTLEDLLREWCRLQFGDAAFDRDNFPFLIKFTTPLSESRRALRLLRSARVWAPTVFPNYDAVQNGIIERSFWK